MAEASQVADDAPPATARHPDGAAIAGDRQTAASGSVATATVTIARPRQELFDYFRDFPNLATFMENVERVDGDRDRPHWVVSAPNGTVEWDAQVTEEQPGSLIAWASAEGADVANSGRVTFEDAGARGTVVTATILYDPPAGALGKLVAKITQKEPAIQVRRDLRRFKQLMETGEIPTNAWTTEQTRADRAPKS